MSDIESLIHRIEALEARIAFQDGTIETLNETVTLQWRQIDALVRQLAGFADRLQQAENTITERGSHEPPPHY